MAEMDASVQSIRNRPMKCKIYLAVEGWIIYACGIHPEAIEDDIVDLFGDYGRVKNLHLNLDKKTCSNKGYVLIEYEELESAENAIKALNNSMFMERKLTVDFAFKSSN